MNLVVILINTKLTILSNIYRYQQNHNRMYLFVGDIGILKLMFTAFRNKLSIHTYCLYMCHIASASIQNYDYIRLEFKGVGASGWLGCPCV